MGPFFFTSPKGKAFAVLFCGYDLRKDGEEFEEIGLGQILAARACDAYISLLQFLDNNWSWCWSWSLHSVTICCKKQKLPDWGVEVPHIGENIVGMVHIPGIPVFWKEIGNRVESICHLGVRGWGVGWRVGVGGAQ